MTSALRGALVAILIGLLAACATPHGSSPTPTERDTDLAASTRQLLAFEGVYDQARQAGQRQGLELAVEFLAGATVDGAGDNSQALLLRQRDNQGNERPFLLVWQPDPQGQPHQAVFSPLDPNDGQALGRCPLLAQLSSAGLLAETVVEECLFGEGASRMALHKEIALDGDQLVIADRVLSQENGEPLQDDVVLRLFRRQRFELRAIDRSDGGQRLAAPSRIDTSGRSVSLSDAAGMRLPFHLRLRYYQLAGGGDEVVLRLSVLDDQGEVVAESWGDHESIALGIAIDTIEVALQRVR
ncbi:MAG: hypothetical protein ACXIUB_04555 [Wenzhouxiangella sp.]